MFSSKSLLVNAYKLAKYQGYSIKDAYYIARSIVLAKYSLDKY